MNIIRAKFPDTRVLVVDDYKVNQQIAQKMLEQLGCIVDVAADGAEVSTLYDKNDYHIIFMDVQMPEIDGYKATNHIRKKEKRKENTPIIAITANALEGDREKCLKAGMNGYIAKPVRIEHLEQTLMKFFPDRAEEA